MIMENDVRQIDANALKKSLQESYDELMRKRNNTPYGEERMIADAQLITFSECILRLKGQPTIDPESLRPVARWVDVKTMGGADCVQCSGCGYREYDHVKYTRFDYCPGCGARMEGKNDG